MPLTAITVTYGANGLVGPGGVPAVGSITLVPVQETPSPGYTIVAQPVTVTVAAGQIVAPNMIYTNGQSGLQVTVYEQIAGAKQPPAYVVSVPTSGTLDLSTALRSPAPFAPMPLYVPLSAVGTANGVAALDANALLPLAQLPLRVTPPWMIAQKYAGLSNPGALVAWPGNNINQPITLAAGTYQNYHFICSELFIPNSNTTLLNCKIECGNSVYGVRLDANTGFETRRYLEHCQITAAGVALAGAGFTARLCEVVNNGDDSARIGRSYAAATSLELCYFHDYMPAAGAHADGVQILTFPAAPVVVYGCYINMAPAAGYVIPPNTGFTGAIFADPADVAESPTDPQPQRYGGIWVDSCWLGSTQNYTVVVDSPGVDIANCVLSTGTTGVISNPNTVVITGHGNTDTTGAPLVDLDAQGVLPAPTTLGQAQDVDIYTSPPTDGEFLAYVAATKKWSPAGAPGGFTQYVNRIDFTSGDIAFPNTSGTFLPIHQVSNGNPLIEADVTASVGHWCELAIPSGLRTTGSAALLDIGVIVGSSVVRWMSSNTATPAADGLVAMYADPSNFMPISIGAPGFTVTSGDLDGGKVRFVLAVNSNGTNTLKCSAGNVVTLIAKNTGPHN